MTVVSMSEREFSRLDVLSDLDSGRIRVGERVIYWVSSGGRCFGF
jgi:hypothetical protein